jgi:hypothetical protein
MSQNLEILGDRQTGQDVRTQNGKWGFCNNCCWLTGSYGLLGWSAKCGVARMTGVLSFSFLVSLHFDGHMV